MLFAGISFCNRRGGLIGPLSLISAPGTLRVWDLDTGTTLNKIHGHGDAVTACATTYNGTHIVSGNMLVVPKFS